MRKLCLFGMLCSAGFAAHADISPVPALSTTPPAHSAPAPLLPLNAQEPKFFGLKGVTVRHLHAHGMPRPDTIESARTIAAPLPVHLSKAKSSPAPAPQPPSPLPSDGILDIFGPQPTAHP